MTYELIITEKPSAAKKIAEALADGKAIKENNTGIPYYNITHGNKDIVVACAVGHLFTVVEVDDLDKTGKKKAWTYPIFDVKWEQSSMASKGAAYTSKYVATLKKLAKDANEFTVACDYDIEGEVIGLNIIKHVCKKKDANRMKFSTLTTDELRKAYANKSKTLNWGLGNAGLTRHELDWYYGINLSRALSLAVKAAGSFKILSSGRVQGPALKIVVDREKEIQAFVPEPYWQLQLLWNKKNNSQEIEAWHTTDKFWKKEEAEIIFNKVNKIKGKYALVKTINSTQFNQAPPTPFDLTTMQIEAYRCLRIQPKVTLEIAQELYIAGVISYPRTSSQKLPKELGHKTLLAKLQNNPRYKELSAKLLAKKELRPNEGKKTDPAHPAIFPTGEIIELTDQQQKLYDLIVKRFLATFADPATRETVTVTLDAAGEDFISKGTRTLEKGWHVYYAPYVKFEEVELPSVKEKEEVNVSNLFMHDKETQPPKRYTPASIIKELERLNLGTKATRATIVETLFDRGYVVGPPLQATKLGLNIVEVLQAHSPQILDQELTRQFEEEMEQIEEGKKSNDQVLNHAKQILTILLNKFKKEEVEIGKELIEAHRESDTIANTVGECHKCHQGVLMIKRGKYGYFIACDKYPDCDVTYTLPSNALIKTTDKLCEICGLPMVNVIRKGKRPQLMCIGPDCSSKLQEAVEAENGKKIELAEKLPQLCPNCGKEIILRKSFYGQFYGCSGYPNCRTVAKINKDGTIGTPYESKPRLKKGFKSSKKKTVGETAKKEETEDKASKKMPNKKVSKTKKKPKK